MNFTLATLMALILALPAGQVVQLCRHESGPVHVFTGTLCDGTLSHSQNPKGHAVHVHASHAHHHGHRHSDEHSQHASGGEHHEPCTHETISKDDRLAKAQPPISVAPDGVATLLPTGQWTSFVTTPPPISLLQGPNTRAPPGPNDPLRQFASCIRLTI